MFYKAFEDDLGGRERGHVHSIRTRAILRERAAAFGADGSILSPRELNPVFSAITH